MSTTKLSLFALLCIGVESYTMQADRPLIVSTLEINELGNEIIQHLDATALTHLASTSQSLYQNASIRNILKMPEVNCAYKFHDFFNQQQNNSLTPHIRVSYACVVECRILRFFSPFFGNPMAKLPTAEIYTTWKKNYGRYLDQSKISTVPEFILDTKQHLQKEIVDLPAEQHTLLFNHLKNVNAFFYLFMQKYRSNPEFAKLYPEAVTPIIKEFIQLFEDDFGLNPK